MAPNELPSHIEQPRRNRERLTTVQKNLRDWLRTKSRSLADLYESAAILLKERSLPGWERYVSHAVREIRNSLPAAFVAESQEGQRQRQFQWKNELGTIREQWDRDGMEARGLFNAEQSLPSQHQELTVPRSTYTTIRDMLDRFIQSEERVAQAPDKFLGMLSQGDEHKSVALRPFVTSFWENGEWFVNNAHDNRRGSCDVDHAELTTRFRKFEQAMQQIMMEYEDEAFYDMVREIDADLDEANK